MGISLWQLFIVFAIVLLLFGTKKLRTFGADLGSAIRSFKSVIRSGDDANVSDEEPTDNTKS